MRFAATMLSLCVAACGPGPAEAPARVDARAPVAAAPTSPLEEVLARDLVSFQPGQLPAPVVDRMVSHRVVLLGEFHQLREHHDFVMTVLEQLHARGTRWLLLEGYHAESWLLDGFVTGRRERLAPSTERVFGYLLGKVRAFNQGRPASEQVHVASVDIDHRAWALPSALGRMSPDMPEATCIEPFLQHVGWDQAKADEDAQTAFLRRQQGDPARYRGQLEALAQELTSGCAQPEAMKRVLEEMVAVALESLAIREVWERDGEHAAHPAREEVIKANVDRRIAAASGTVLINVGGMHVQKEHAMGTPKAWLGEHLESPSSASKGSSLSVFVSFARVEKKPGGPWWSLTDGVVEGELLAAILARVGDDAAFLPLSDPLFGEERPVNYMYQSSSHPPGRLFDAFVLLPEAHRMP